jgi:preprotein translocase subunit YajC
LNLTLALFLAAAAPAADAGGAQDFFAGPFGTLIFFGGMAVLMYLFLFRPQQQARRQHQAAISAIKRGDSVVLSSGVIGKVVRVEDKELGVEVAQNVTIKVIKSMVAEVRARGEPAAANDSKP